MGRESRQRCHTTTSVRRSILAWVSGTLIAAATVAIMAVPGVLDPAFNGTGIVRSPFVGAAKRCRRRSSRADNCRRVGRR